MSFEIKKGDVHVLSPLKLYLVIFDNSLEKFCIVTPSSKEFNSFGSVSTSNNSVVYAVSSNGLVSRSSNGGTSFANVTTATLPGRYATNVAVDPGNADIVYVTYSGFDESTPTTPGHVFKTTDGGASWTNITGTLPNIPFTAIEVRPDSSMEIYAGSDTGVYISLNGGTTWAKMSVGLPNAGVADLTVNATTDLWP